MRRASDEVGAALVEHSLILLIEPHDFVDARRRLECLCQFASSVFHVIASKRCVCHMRLPGNMARHGSSLQAAYPLPIKG